MIYVKLDPKDANTADSYHLKSDTIYSQWELSILRNYQQTPNKIIKNQGENKNRNIYINLKANG